MFRMAGNAIQDPCPTLADWLRAKSGKPMGADVVDPIDDGPVPTDATIFDLDVDNGPAPMSLSVSGEDGALVDGSDHVETNTPTPMDLKLKRTSCKREFSEV
jgi:hypothetical protein